MEIRTLLLIATVLTLAATPALAANPPEPVHWIVDDGYATTADRSGTELTWSSSARTGFVLGSLEVGGHPILAGLYAPVELGAPVARGATLSWNNPPEPVHLRVWDNKPALFELACGDAAPPDPILPPNPCMIAFPEGHVLDVVRSQGGQTELVVSTVTERTIIPCVRVLVDGPVEVDGLTLTFGGKLTTKLASPPEPVAPGGEITPRDG